jgi:hypothetical protein
VLGFVAGGAGGMSIRGCKKPLYVGSVPVFLYRRAASMSKLRAVGHTIMVGM